MYRELVPYKHYFWDFYNSQSEQVREKIDYVFQKIMIERIVPKIFLKHIEGNDDLYEIRVKTGSNIYRIFCFFEEGRLIILLHGIQKKKDKLPRKEIERAERLKRDYYENKRLSKKHKRTL